MRKYLVYILEDHTSGPDSSGLVSVRDSPVGGRKGERIKLGVFDTESKERGHRIYIPLGYHDFEDESDYNDRIMDVIERKIGEVEIPNE